MLGDDDALPVVVYLDAGAAPADPALAAARQQSVRVYLRDHGLMDNQVKVVDGRNATTYAPAAPKIHAARAADAKANAASQGGTAGGGGRSPGGESGKGWW
jgi:hypothetical protein